MELSNRCEYALRALIDLAMAREAGRSLLPARELIAHENLPKKFLQTILLELKEPGWVETLRGRNGGYRLAVDAGDIVMGDVVRLMDGPLSPIRCVGESTGAPCSCPDEDHCGLRLLMIDVHNAIADILDRYTLANVVDVTIRKLRRDGLSLPFHQGAQETVRGA